MRSHICSLLASLLALALLAPAPLKADVTWVLHDFQACSTQNNFQVYSCQDITGFFDVQGTGDPSSVPQVSDWDIIMSGGSVNWGGPTVNLYNFEFTPTNSYLGETTYYTGQQPWSVSGFQLLSTSYADPGGTMLGSFEVGFGDGGLTQSGGTVNIAEVWQLGAGAGFPGITGEALLQDPWDGRFGMEMYIASGFVTGAGSTTVPTPEPSSLSLELVLLLAVVLTFRKRLRAALLD